MHLLVAALLFAQPAEVRRVHVERTEHAPLVDGRLDDAAWAHAEPTSRFVQLIPEEGAPAGFRTELRLLMDDRFLYVGARMFDPQPWLIQRQLTRRDSVTQADTFAISLDTYHDRRTAHVFQVNASGVQRDLLVYDDVQEDDRWDAVWSSAVQVDAEGWTAELAIPLGQLHPASALKQWGLQATRVVFRTGETSAWQLIAQQQGVGVSRFGELELPGTDAHPAQLELRPYVSGAGRFYRRDSPENPFQTGHDLSASAGADVKYTLGQTWNLSATVNPDFGQVEADPAQVNLTDQELLLTERRPFFLEGLDLFQLGATPAAQTNPTTFFYSRRMGATPTFQPANRPPGTTFVDPPGTTPILGALKLTGRMPGGLSLGLIDVVTLARDERYADAQGQVLKTRLPVAPLTNFLVLRGAQDFDDGASRVGLFFTGVNRRLQGTLMSEIPSNAYVGGADWQLRFGGNRYFVSGKVAASHVEGSDAAMTALQTNSERYEQRPDAKHLQVDPSLKSLNGSSGELYVGRSGDARLQWRVGASYDTPDFEANDLGYQVRADDIGAHAQLTWQDLVPGKHLQKWSLTANADGDSNFGGEQLPGYLQLTYNAVTPGFQNVTVDAAA